MRNDSSTVASAEAFDGRSRDVEWYDKELTEVKPVCTRIAGEREKAWDIWPYPCIGGFRFLDLTLSTLPQCSEDLEHVKNVGRLLDLGCFFGQALRKLIFDGAPSDKLYGADLRPEFFELGYELFQDKQTCKTAFFAANIFEPSPQLDALKGQLSIVYTAAFFHLFDRPQQLQVTKRVVSLLSPRPGSMMLGRQVGNVNPGRFEHATNNGRRMFRHNEQSWNELWEEVGSETGSRWEVWVEMRETSTHPSTGPRTPKRAPPPQQATKKRS